MILKILLGEQEFSKCIYGERFYIYIHILCYSTKIYPVDGFDRILVVSVEKDQVEEREGEDTGQ